VRVGVGSRCIPYERAGNGPSIVFLHGFVGDHREWRAQIDGLAAHHDVVAWDAPGAGHSDDPPPAFRLADYADSLAAFIGALGLDRPHVAGLSFGGALALELYRRHPAIPRSLILVNAYAGWRGSLPADEVTRRLERSLKLAAGPPEDFVQAMLPTMFPPGTPPSVTETLAAIMSEVHPHGFRAMLLSLAEADLRDVLPRVVVPTLVVHGDLDVRAPRAVAEALHRGISGSELVVIPGSGHVTSMDAGPQLTEIMDRFLTGLRQPR